MAHMTIPRITMPARDQFYRDFMLSLTPAVITDLFTGDPIRGITTKQDALRVWSDIRVPVQEEYGRAYQAQAQPGADDHSTPLVMSLGEYFDYVSRNPGTALMCIECPTPSELRPWYRIPDVCAPAPSESRQFVNQIFVGNYGNVANIHFDKAGMHGFLYQVFGRKRFIVFPQDASPKLAPFTQTGCWLVQNMSDGDRRAFLDFTGGQEVILDAGDCMYVPSLCWHFADYIEDSMAISLRFRRSATVTKLVNALFPDMYMQGIAYALAGLSCGHSAYDAVMEELADADSGSYVDGVEKVRYMRCLARRLHGKLHPLSPSAPYMIEFEDALPPLLPAFADAFSPQRPRYD